MTGLYQTLGYTFRDPALLRRALTHPSAGAENNQRLEFLGDAVLEYIVSDMLYARYPGLQEGRLTHLRQLLVCEAALSGIAEELGLGRALIMDPGEELTGGREKPSVLCDTMEAVLAAVYLDGGMAPARALVARFWPDPETVCLPMNDAKSLLQEKLQVKGGHAAAPTYAIVASAGPTHAPVFEAAVSHDGRELARGRGKTKKAAEQAAALAALERLRE